MDTPTTTATDLERPPVLQPQVTRSSGADLTAVLAELERLEQLADSLDARLDSGAGSASP